MTPPPVHAAAAEVSAQWRIGGFVSLGDSFQSGDSFHWGIRFIRFSAPSFPRCQLIRRITRFDKALGHVKGRRRRSRDGEALNQRRRLVREKVSGELVRGQAIVRFGGFTGTYSPGV
jgi:hypothetical protein